MRDAASRAGISETTAYRRLRDPDFKRQVAESRAEMLERAAGALAMITTRAVLTLAKLLDAESEQVRLGAARATLETSLKFRDALDLERRITELEERADATRADPTPRPWRAS